MKRRFGEDLAGKTFAVWGLAFKPETDDVREAPSFAVIRSILEAGGRIRAFDPKAIDTFRNDPTLTAWKPELVERIRYETNRNDALRDADALILVTEWKEFWNPDWDLVKRHLKQPVVFDGRNIFAEAELEERGFSYVGIGLGST